MGTGGCDIRFISPHGDLLCQRAVVGVYLAQGLLDEAPLGR